MTFSQFVQILFDQPTMLLMVGLTLSVILVNGWTDAPNAITSCISTGAMAPRKAIALAAICNFLGVTVMTWISPTVAATIYNMVDMQSGSEMSLISLMAAMTAIVIWAVAAWIFAIPTSESHALIAALSGAAVALHGSFEGINTDQWSKVIWGLFISVFFGFCVSWLFTRIIAVFGRGAKGRFFYTAQIFAAGVMAFMHGAQDGQKFMAVFLLGITLSAHSSIAVMDTFPFWLMLLCSAVMAAGTAMGGMRIVRAVGIKMVQLRHYQGFSADISAAFCLFCCSLLGIPVSTTHTKTTAIMGAGAAEGISGVDWGIVRNMVMAWLLTFPCCGILGYLLAKLFITLSGAG